MYWYFKTSTKKLSANVQFTLLRKRLFVLSCFQNTCYTFRSLDICKLHWTFYLTCTCIKIILTDSIYEPGYLFFRLSRRWEVAY